MNRIVIQLTDDQVNALHKISEKEGASIAWQIRKAVDEYLKQRKETKR